MTADSGHPDFWNVRRISSNTRRPQSLTARQPMQKRVTGVLAAADGVRQNCIGA
jgi:hypothetical protein